MKMKLKFSMRISAVRSVNNMVKLLLSCIVHSISNGATISEITPRYPHSCSSALVVTLLPYMLRRKVVDTCSCYYDKIIKAVHIMSIVDNEYLILVFQQSRTT